MTEAASIYDVVRTLRSKGKPDGSLSSVKLVDMAVGIRRPPKQRNSLDTSRVDDVILGWATSVGEQLVALCVGAGIGIAPIVERL